MRLSKAHQLPHKEINGICDHPQRNTSKAKKHIMWVKYPITSKKHQFNTSCNQNLIHLDSCPCTYPKPPTGIQLSSQQDKKPDEEKSRLRQKQKTARKSNNNHF
jgi:hypothetical protein